MLVSQGYVVQEGLWDKNKVAKPPTIFEARREFGQTLKVIRRVQGLTGQQAAGAAGISRAYLVQIESGAREHPSRQVLEGIRAAYGLDPNLFGDLVLRWRIRQALEERGLPLEARGSIWTALADHIRATNLGVETDPAEVVIATLKQHGLPT